MLETIGFVFVIGLIALSGAVLIAESHDILFGKISLRRFLAYLIHAGCIALVSLEIVNGL